MDTETRLRSLPISEIAWKKAKECADKTKPRSSRPAWIENAIYEQAKREVKNDDSN